MKINKTYLMQIHTIRTGYVHHFSLFSGSQILKISLDGSFRETFINNLLNKVCEHILQTRAAASDLVYILSSIPINIYEQVPDHDHE